MFQVKDSTTVSKATLLIKQVPFTNPPLPFRDFTRALKDITQQNETIKKALLKAIYHSVSTMKTTPSNQLAENCIAIHVLVHHYVYVTGFEITRLPRTQQEDTLFTITGYSCTACTHKLTYQPDTSAESYPSCFC